MPTDVLGKKKKERKENAFFLCQTEYERELCKTESFQTATFLQLNITDKTLIFIQTSLPAKSRGESQTSPLLCWNQSPQPPNLPVGIREDQLESKDFAPCPKESLLYL